MKINNKSVILLLLIAAIAVSFSSCSFLKKHWVYIDDIDEYGIEKLSNSDDIFSVEIPPTANVTDFSSFSDDLYHLTDIYLELKFANAEELELYVNQILTNIANEYRDYCMRANYVYDGAYYSEQNPYNAAYTDIFSYNRAWIGTDKIHFGYEIDPDELYEYEVYFSLVSYSVDELTVIQTFSAGAYSADIHECTPKYFERFNVPANEYTEHWIYVDRIKQSE